MSEQRFEPDPPPIRPLGSAVVSRGRGRITPRWQKGESGNPYGRYGHWGKEVMGLIREATPEAIKRLVYLANHSKDERVQAVCASKICEIAQIPKPKLEDDRPRLDLSALSNKELEQLRKLLGKAAKAGGLPGVTTIEAEVSDEG